MYYQEETENGEDVSFDGGDYSERIVRTMKFPMIILQKKTMMKKRIT